jgi:hypothetical protein
MSQVCHTPFLTLRTHPAIDGLGVTVLPQQRQSKATAPFRAGNMGAIEEDRMGSRLTWPQIRRKDEFRGRWVALDECKYDPRTAQPTEGTVVDADADLVALCARMQASDSKHCAILFCDERASADDPPPSTLRNASSTPPRAFH